MHFKNPELLYALFLLIIPIIVHLFQLRRFQKEAFSNVQFLKAIILQTRKSSQLKKWLVLSLRLLALGCIIIAFAQPLKASKNADKEESQTVIYLDNSFSLQAKGSSGELLKNAVQELYKSNIPLKNLSWFTNSQTYKNVETVDFKNDILKVDYSAQVLPMQDVILKAEQLFTSNNSSEKHFIMLSDFQETQSLPNLENSEIKFSAVQLSPVTHNNIAIDTAYISKTDSETLYLRVGLKNQGSALENVPVSLFKEKTLMAKSSVSFKEQNTAFLDFTLDIKTAFNGKISINDQNLPFDNSLYFNKNKNTKIKILAIQQANSDFIKRLFSSEEFSLTIQDYKQLSYSSIPENHFIILNELRDIPPALATILSAFINNGGSLLVIPSEEINLKNYNRFLNTQALGVLRPINKQEKYISNISFQHPLFEGVFDKPVKNFQYPKIKSYYPINQKASTALSFEDESPFLLQQNKVFLMTAPINLENSNFKNAPLIVPTLYKMALQSLPLPKLYFEIGKNNSLAVAATLSQDEIVSISDSLSSFIPLQQAGTNSVTITTQNNPTRAGIYTLSTNGHALEHISYNYPRNESHLNYHELNKWEGVKVHDTIDSLFNILSQNSASTNYWKLFAIFALILLLIEMLILKFFK